MCDICDLKREAIELLSKDCILGYFSKEAQKIFREKNEDYLDELLLAIGLTEPSINAMVNVDGLEFVLKVFNYIEIIDIGRKIIDEAVEEDILYIQN